MATLPASCWCERTQVRVPVMFVIQGTTATCGHPECRPGCNPAPGTDTTDTKEIRAMRRFNPAKYDPADDSSAGYTESTGTVTIVVGTGICACGCETAISGKSSRFAPGHDQRFKGVLIRAAVTGTPITMVGPEVGSATITQSPWEVAAMLSSDTTDWVSYIEPRVQAHKDRIAAAAEAAAKREAAKAAKAEAAAAAKAAKEAAKAAKAVEPKRIEVKIGRWTYPAVEAADGSIIVTKKDGTTAAAVKDDSGKVKWAA